MPLCSTGFSFNNNTCRCESEEDPIGDHSDATIDMNERYNRLSGHQSVPDKVVDTEINAQNNKALNILNNKGINPDLNDDYRENSGS
ncbi:unnamed protein product [Medioppia subpectinata]|uniref:Uncharacterized protein n=1 Tax=Medioppia subpectinata TaxID=1979941 RepID=A0A7R9KU40_9ACAR|nr:unnamed protein product [Medioppia subpectinata]CAG2108709.1 unnamed protein product [Medioppia subpectinata]